MENKALKEKIINAFWLDSKNQFDKKFIDLINNWVDKNNVKSVNIYMEAERYLERKNIGQPAAYIAHLIPVNDYDDFMNLWYAVGITSSNINEYGGELSYNENYITFGYYDDIPIICSKLA